MLIALLKNKKANASFIIMPLNPYCYTNLHKLSPTINLLDEELKRNHFPFLNMWCDKPENYDKGVLKDIMHLGDYGWYQVNRFIVNTYKLSK